MMVVAILAPVQPSGWPERYAAALGIEQLMIADAQFLGAVNSLRREGFVDFP